MRKINHVLATLLVVGCSSDPTTDPGTRNAFDANGVSTHVATIERVAAAPALESYRVLGRYIGVASSAPRVEGAPAIVAVARRIAELTGVGSGAQLVPVVRPGVLGRTYVFDAATGTYAHDAARTGAPANGVRFVLYETDAATGAIKQPLVEIGYADLIDERAGSPNSAGLRFRVVSGGVTALEYAFEISGLVVAPVLTVNGFMSDGTERVNFELALSGPAWGHGGTATLNAKLELPSQDFRVETTLEAAAGEEGGPSEIVMTIRGGSDVIVVTSRVAAGQVDVTVTVNGKVLATATGDAAHPVLKGEGGRELTAEELAALGQIVEFANGVFELFGELLAPAGALLGLALGLVF